MKLDAVVSAVTGSPRSSQQCSDANQEVCAAVLP
jgi:hypothetical protein